MAFTGVLKFLNKMTSPAARSGFLAANVGEIDTAITAQNLDELTTWLVLEVSTKDSACKDTADDLYAFIKGATTALTVLAAASAANRDSVADFLTEALRVCNFAKHDKAIIGQFIAIMGLCAITIVGNPSTCQEMATFGALGYSRTTHQVTMQT